MTNEAREQIAKFASENIALYDCFNNCPDEVALAEEKGADLRTPEYCNNCFAKQLIAKFESLGYRPRPKLTLISPEEIKNKVEDAFKEDDLLRHYVESRGHWEDIAPAIAQAQLDHNLREG